MLSWLPSPLLRLLAYLSLRWTWLASLINAAIINASVTACRRRPHPWSTVHPYVSWTSLTDQSWSARHLPTAQLSNLPSLEKVREFFTAPPSGQQYCKKSTLLFPAFAQYLTDGFIRTVMPNESTGESDMLRRRNTSNHQIDLCPLYGRTQEQTLALREKSDAPGRKGRLKSQLIDIQLVGKKEEFPPYLFDVDGTSKPEFDKLDRILGLDKATAEQKTTLFALGGDRANTSPQIAMINTLFLREHNRLAKEIETANPDWDDEHVFQVARNTVIVLFIKIVVEEYIRHIAPTPFLLFAAPSAVWTAPWNKPNWITVEFSLLYRWHSLIPEMIRWGKKDYAVHETLLNNAPLIGIGLRQAFLDMSDQRATRLGPFNTARVLIDFEDRALRQSRICEVDTYAQYRRHMNLSEPRSFEDISSNRVVVAKLRELYSDPSQVEFYVGLFAEDTVANSPLPELLLRLVAVDAFSQALTNPLLSEHVFKESAFSPPGWKAIHDTASLKDILDRNCRAPASSSEFIGMTQQDWSYTWPHSVVGEALTQAAALVKTPEGKSKAAGFVLSTVAEVAGLLLWLYCVSTDRSSLGFFWLVGGEAIEWSLLAYMIMTSRFSYPKQTGQIPRGLITTALISLLEAFLWVAWLYLIGHIGVLPATAALAVAMHLKHDAEMAVFTGRPLFGNLFDRSDVWASALEAIGAGIWFTLTMSGHYVIGAAILLVCIAIEHILQFKTAGFLHREAVGGPA